MTSDNSTVPSSLPSLDHHTTSVSSRFPVATPSDSYSTYRTTSSSITEDGASECYSSDADYDDDRDSRHEQVRPHPRSGLSYNQTTYAREPFEQRAVASTPAQFAQHFPSKEPLFIKHDASAPDGDMNLRVDCRSSHGHRITLFHARIYDQRDRDVSIRRYGRDCGREVAHAKRKFEKPAAKKQRPALTKAFTSFRGKTLDQQREIRHLERQDSGYSTASDEDSEVDEINFSSSTGKPSKATNIVNLEFANYAHVDLTRKGGKQHKKYEFEYWGRSYAWKRTLPSSSDDSASYNLINNSTGNTVARIRPDPTAELISGFVRPCTLVFRDSVEDPIESERCDVYE